MNYVGMPHGMWLLYRSSFHRYLISVLGFSTNHAAAVTDAAKRKYKEII